MNKNAKLNEGIIKVPTKLENDILNFVFYNFFWFVRNRFTPEIKKSAPHLWDDFKNQLSKNNITLPKEKYKLPPDKRVFKNFTFDFDELPDNYKRLTPDHTFIQILIDWNKHEDRGASLAEYNTGKMAGKPASLITLYLNYFFDHNMAYPSKYHTVNEIPLMLTKIRSAVRHELMHLIQHILFKNVDKSQLSKKKNYDEDETDYYLSNIEFDPIISSLSENLATQFKINLSRSKISLEDAIKYQVGLKQPPNGSPYQPVDFFTVLKNNNIKKWKLAVKKFSLEVVKQLSR